MNQPQVVDEERIQVAVKKPLQLVATTPPAPPLRQKALFEDSLLESSGGQRKRRTWATIVSLTLQCFLVGVLALIPLWFTDVLPKEQLVTYLVAPPPPPPPPPPPAAPHPAVKVVKMVTEMENGQLRAPTSIPKKILMIKETEAPLPASGIPGGVPGGIPGGQVGGVIGGVIGSLSHSLAVPKLYRAPTPKRIRVSQGVTEGLLIRRIEPVYPVIAKEARIQGTVVLSAIIAKDGTIKDLQLVSGHPMLAPAAIEAVKRWRYKPYLLSGIPVEVETTITVNFRLGG
jgi:periplasmic protein TonB